MHLLFDGKVSRVLTCEDLAAILPELVKEIGMTPLGAPMTIDSAVGPSAIQFIIESHIAINYIGNFITTDIFSCKDFNAGAIARKLIEIFCISEVTFQLLLYRGFV